MGYFNGMWSSLQYSLGKTTENIAVNNLRYRYTKGDDGSVIYRNNRDGRAVAVRVLTQQGFQIVEAELNKLWPRYVRHIEEKVRKEQLELQRKNVQSLIKQGKTADLGLGVIKTKEGKEIVAVDAYGQKVPEALILYYDSEKTIQCTIRKPSSKPASSVINRQDDTESETISTCTVYFADVTPHVNQSTSKNIILTKVQGRDYTRKELVAGGDISFSVSGEINSNQDGIYPENDVKKFIQIMQHNGVIKVNHLLFKQFNINQIIIQDFKLGAQEYKNIQPYSFTCVAVEPDEDVIVSQDTINVINTAIAEQDLSTWYKLVLGYKLSQIKGKGGPEWDSMSSMLPDIISNVI